MTSSKKSNTLAAEDGPMWITADCEDPLYNRPVIDSETDHTTPVPHHRVSGHFEGTNKKFNFYFPLKSQWKGRFFHLVYPLIDENATDETISFGVDSGAYTVQTNGGGGYRVDAAAAKFSRTVAASYYGSSERIYGYIYGGSGGSYQTIGAIENTNGVWDGAVPFIPGVPTSIPNNFFARAFARFVLEEKVQKIADAVSPGGSGNPYIGLNEVERAVLEEVTKLGVPMQAWEDYTYLLGMNDPQGLLGFGGVVRTTDSNYVSDFWSKKGYLGTEQSALGELFRNAKIDHIATIKKVNRNEQNEPISLVLNSLPADLAKNSLEYTLYTSEGTPRVETLAGSLDPDTKVFTIGCETPESVLSVIDEGAKLRIDNRWYLALLSYHRHQVPQQPGYDAWDHLRGFDGTPLYPQRTIELGPMISLGVSDSGTHTGMIQGKVIMVANIIDNDAYPWHGDWYRERVKESLGERCDDNFRLWYNDNADHIGPRTARLVQYEGILQQALRDCSAWAEKGVEPAQSTLYNVVNSQIKLPKKAEERQGIQPVIDLTANGFTRIEITSGQIVNFEAKIQVPPKAGKVVAAEWDFLGTGDFTASPIGNLESVVEVKDLFTYNSPGTYFPAIRVTSHREGDPNTPFAKIQNLDRVRVVVH
ncbi:Tat pathway signal sequence domain protein [Neobacillus drentensis]|uniref:Tat pathway signal sequence domain protein n=1 Tax=Neobacillus drentensis TaxID=220684 RepID=UPI001F238EAC|nr:Tat pathway signal sequence domain protein [Neobacillus drentensis]ULT54880.1 Tat pathway signal sequence domain protein [Neobacillus drentensis]